MSARGLALAVALAWTGATAQEGDPLAAARAQLEAAKFEEALDTLKGLLARPELPPDLRLEARILRSQALVAVGETGKAEAEWAEILGERPGFRPDPSGVPQKALKRFEALRAAKVGTVRLNLDPTDAGLALDGRSARRDPDGTLPVLAGTHTLRAERPGFDPAEATLAVGAGGTVDLVLHLTPNARTVVVQAEPAGAEVLLDGAPVGRTEVPAEGGLPALVLEDVPLGEHTFELRLACHRPARAVEMLTVDLLDRSPRRLGPYRLESARGTLAVTGLAGAALQVDGTGAGPLPQPALEACAGERRLTATRSGRRVWAGSVDLADGERMEVPMAARPNLVLVGVEVAPLWASAWSVATLEAPAGFDPSSPVSWKALALPSDTDLAWSPGGAWSPWLEAVIPLPSGELLSGPPPRTRGSAGIGLADGGPWGTARVVRLRPEGPAQRAGVRLGERVAAVDGVAVPSAREGEAAIASAAAPAVELTLEGGSPSPRHVRVELAPSPWLPPPPSGPAEAALRAAWAAAQSAAEPEALAAAADLAASLAAAGRAEAAIERWRSVPFGGRAGIGEGTGAYFLGRALQAAGRSGEAAAALSRAAASKATAESDDGPPLAPAASSAP